MKNQGSNEIRLRCCPFCGKPLVKSSGEFNVIARCGTKGCWMNSMKISIPMDDPVQVAQWNTRVIDPVYKYEVLEAMKGISISVVDAMKKITTAERTLTGNHSHIFEKRKH